MDWLTTITAVVTTIGTTAVIAVPVVRKFKSFTHSWDLFMRDWSGEETRPGHDAEPGVMERLNNLDGQFKKNHGTSLKDVVDRIEKKINAIDKRLEDGNARFEQIEKELDKNG
jgi:hypothetical protein